MFSAMPLKLSGAVGGLALGVVLLLAVETFDKFHLPPTIYLSHPSWAIRLDHNERLHISGPPAEPWRMATASAVSGAGTLFQIYR